MAAPRRTTAALRGPRGQRGRFGIRLGLGRTRALLRRWAIRSWPARRADRRHERQGQRPGAGGGRAPAAGYRVGETPKPHLVTYRERLAVDGRPIAAGLRGLVDEVLEHADALRRRHGPADRVRGADRGRLPLVRRVRLDVAVVEVGLGGRLDATHAWDGGVAAITNVALDHMERLGATVQAIAREKAAIIKRGDLAVTGAIGDALCGHPAPRAAARGAPDEVGAGAVLGWIATGSGRPAASRVRPGSGLRGGTRRRTPAWRCGARRARGGRHRVRVPR